MPTARLRSRSAFPTRPSGFRRHRWRRCSARVLIRKAAASPDLTLESGRGLVSIVSRYTQTFLWLQQYDEGLLQEPAGEAGGVLPSPDQARSALAELKAQLIARKPNPVA